MIELQNLAGKSDQSNRDQDNNRQHRRDQKRERKLQRILGAEEMKFSHSIQFNAVPDWSSSYISYSNLKKL